MLRPRIKGSNLKLREAKQGQPVAALKQEAQSPHGLLNKARPVHTLHKVALSEEIDDEWRHDHKE